MGNSLSAVLFFRILRGVSWLVKWSDILMDLCVKIKYVKISNISEYNGRMKSVEIYEKTYLVERKWNKGMRR